MSPENCTVTCISGGIWQINSPGCPDSQFFTFSGIFQLIAGITLIRVLLVGGGGSGINGDCGGGGGGYVACGNFTVSNGFNVSVTVGAGGSIGPSAGLLPVVFSVQYSTVLVHVFNCTANYI